jgi:hypothetical protein
MKRHPKICAAACVNSNPHLAAGSAIGPSTPEFIGDANLANQLVEIGFILLMFGAVGSIVSRAIRSSAMKYLLVPAHLVRLAVALTVLLCSSGAFAQGTAQERAACGSDFKRFCRHTQGGMAAGSCLQAHRNHLHGSCRRVLKAHGM